MLVRVSCFKAYSIDRDVISSEVVVGTSTKVEGSTSEATSIVAIFCEKTCHKDGCHCEWLRGSCWEGEIFSFLYKEIVLGSVVSRVTNRKTEKKIGKKEDEKRIDGSE